MTKVVNLRKEKYDVYIGRGSKWGNPFKIGRDGNREEVIEKYKQYILNKKELLEDLDELRGKVLGCYCVEKPIDYVRENKRCHGEILVELLGEKESDEKV